MLLSQILQNFCLTYTMEKVELFHNIITGHNLSYSSGMSQTGKVESGKKET